MLSLLVKVTVVANSNDTQFLIPVTKKAIFADKASRTFTVVLSDAIQDQLGNKIAATTQNVTLTKDTVKPVATGYKVIKDNDGKVTAVEVNFSEGLAVTPLAIYQQLLMKMVLLFQTRERTLS